MEKQSKLQWFLPILKNENVNHKREMLAGLTTFLTMAYIIAVNPSILSETGMHQGALVTATCLSAGIACILMGLFANLPFALASGMGLNAFFAYSVVLKENIPWETALTAVFIEGIIFIVLSLFKIREAVVNSIPLVMKHAVTAGIGLFIAFVGFVGCGLVIKNDATLVGLGKFSVTVIIALIGLFIISILDKKKVKGAILIGIVVSTLLAWGYALINKELSTELGIYLPDGIFRYESLSPIAMKLNFDNILSKELIGKFTVIMLTFLFVDFFDTVGTLVGVASRAKMLDKDGKVPNAGRALLVDAIGTTYGAVMGTSTVTTYVESSTGVMAGGRTGYTAITTGVLFIIATFFSPIFISIPACATAPALIYVGYLMMGSVKEIDFDNITDGLPAFLTLSGMVLTYSIGDGLTIGILSYVIINLLYNMVATNKEKKKLSPVMLCLAILFIAKLLFL